MFKKGLSGHYPFSVETISYVYQKLVFQIFRPLGRKRLCSIWTKDVLAKCTDNNCHKNNISIVNQSDN